MKHYLMPGLFLLLSAALMFSCKTEKMPQKKETESKIPISLSTTISTKASETDFESNDKIGLYVQYASEDYITNEPFTYDNGKWSPSKELYWKDNKTTANFYCYYPYKGSASNITKVEFSVQDDQSTQDAIKASDFLWGKSLNVAPSENPVEITSYHRVAKVVIRIKPGKGYTEEMLASKDIKVCLSNLLTTANVNILDGTVNATGNKKDVTPSRSGDSWIAYVIPQSIENSDLVKVQLDNNEYILTGSVSFSANKVQECTLTINRTSEGVNIGIGGWESSETDFGGTLS